MPECNCSPPFPPACPAHQKHQSGWLPASWPIIPKLCALHWHFFRLLVFFHLIAHLHIFCTFFGSASTTNFYTFCHFSAPRPAPGFVAVTGWDFSFVCYFSPSFLYFFFFCLTVWHFLARFLVLFLGLLTLSSVLSLVNDFSQLPLRKCLPNSLRVCLPIAILDIYCKMHWLWKIASAARPGSGPGCGFWGQAGAKQVVHERSHLVSWHARPVPVLKSFNWTLCNTGRQPANIFDCLLSQNAAYY